jgi:hypothetical protein
MAEEDTTIKEKPEGYIFGRPTKYTPELIDKVKEYLDQCQDEWDEFHKTRGDKSDSYERVLKAKVPTREGFAIYIDTTTNTLTDWEEKYPDFLRALKVIDQTQKERLFQGGLSGTYNPIIAKLGLSANHGMREKSDITTDDQKITSVKVEIVK